MTEIKTLGQLKASNYSSKSIKNEIRDNLIANIKAGKNSFPGIRGFEETVIPDLERAILSRHNVLLLGLRGQAKTRIARLLVNLLDEYIPAIEGTAIQDDPLHPISYEAKAIVEAQGDDTPITWIHRSDRFVEKLATPDVSVADLIGDVDPIKAATLKLPYSDERVIHFGLVPRSHRSIFVLNELPDLQARIQVTLFNILQEGDLQIRGFKLRMPLDIQFLFTANPEDYTNRGSIITPLKDRIESQILTHYPKSIQESKMITQQEARVDPEQKSRIRMPELIANFIEYVTFAARTNDMVDEKSGVSARLSISAYENIYSAAERRRLINGEDKTTIRLSDFWGIIPSITGKVELVYEGEESGPYQVALEIINNAIEDLFLEYFENPDDQMLSKENPYTGLKEDFENGLRIDLYLNESDENYQKSLDQIVDFDKLIDKNEYDESDTYILKELLLFGLSTFNFIEKEFIQGQYTFSDPLSDLFDDDDLSEFSGDDFDPF